MVNAPHPINIRLPPPCSSLPFPSNPNRPRPPPPRDLMVHLPARHNLKIIQNVQASGARFLMASTYVQADENAVSETFVPPVGHNINLSLPPYCLPEPIEVFDDESTDRTDLRMGLWDLNQDVPLALGGDCSPMVTTTTV